ncbi:MAG: tRNA (adenosine(37)-N6)-threonylcarbamoyltransferase complex ATPase subunit type 1 TsaE [Nitriliruptorales bacterium]|nr:tRNA (adenosine(37)-N6)-threonylcarbamoyltransferase complex ATPase subunit type 1 TsaE [Nitriliruptorales bacterium]
MGGTDGLVLRTTSAADTRAAAAALAQHLRPGDVVSLTGELGAGKTCFVQGIANALRVERRVTSPTFMLVKLYDDADIPLVHVDVYRLDRLQDVLDLGDEVMSPDRVTLIEWGDAIATLLPEDRLEVAIRLATDDLDADRLMELRPVGSFEARRHELAAACHRWQQGEA